MLTYGTPIISFLHVPGKMSQPLWLMMGTAFRVSLPCATQAPLFLTAKHTFMPWEYVKDASQMKIPEDYRKLRYVVGRGYCTTTDGKADVARACPMTLVATHPTLDVALLCTSVANGDAGAGGGDAAKSRTVATALDEAAPLSLCAAPLANQAQGTITGFRGVGKLGELDTFDPAILNTLSPAERDALLKELQNVEGKQAYASVAVEVLDGRGMCRATKDGEGCFHGMSGGPLLVTNGDVVECGGILYGKHPDAPANIGYTPANEVIEWAVSVATRSKRPSLPQS